MYAHIHGDRLYTARHSFPTVPHPLIQTSSHPTPSPSRPSVDLSEGVQCCHLYMSPGVTPRHACRNKAVRHSNRDMTGARVQKCADTYMEARTHDERAHTHTQRHGAVGRNRAAATTPSFSPSYPLASTHRHPYSGSFKSLSPPPLRKPTFLAVIVTVR